MKDNFEVGDHVCKKEDPNTIYYVWGGACTTIGIEAANGHRELCESSLLEYVPAEDERVGEYEKLCKRNSDTPIFP